ncbi:hypothetical protein SMU3_04376 [Streptococcus mutans 11A1]|nr:hypothetical protein SMU3_04376 [Streptococcus mutans 11A1]
MYLGLGMEFYGFSEIIHWIISSTGKLKQFLKLFEFKKKDSKEKVGFNLRYNLFQT